MDNREIEDLARRVQSKAERTHHLSAVYAAEQFLREKRAMELEKAKAVLNAKFTDSAINNSNFEPSQDLKDELGRHLKNEKDNQPLRIIFLYADIYEEHARNISIGNGELALVLPLKRQAVIDEGLKEGKLENGKFVWTSAMKFEKGWLRTKTLHEIGHLVIDAEQGKLSTEDEANTFAKEIALLRSDRDNILQYV